MGIIHRLLLTLNWGICAVFLYGYLEYKDTEALLCLPGCLGAHVLINWILTGYIPTRTTDATPWSTDTAT